MSITREYDLREIRRLLGNPVEGRPDLDIIVSNMIAAEQFLLNRQTGVNKDWTHKIVPILTVAGTATYIVSVGPGRSFGKAVYVYRDNDGVGQIEHLPLIDFTEDANNNRYDFWVANPPTGRTQIALFRDAGDVKMHVYPTPTDETAISIGYASGVIDWTQVTLSGEADMPEFARLRHLHAALATIGKAEWDGFTPEMNSNQRRELQGWLLEEYKLHDAMFTEYLNSTQAEAHTSDVARRRADNLAS